MNRQIWKKLLMYFPAVCLMIVIFLFSSQPAEESSAESSRIVGMVLHFWETIRGIKFSAQEFALWAEKIHTPVRKLAHMTEYAVLSLSIFIPSMAQHTEGLYILVDSEKKKRMWKKAAWAKLVLVSMAVVLVYAATDEFHQLFVEGRSGKLTDVLIDGCGAILGIFAFLLFWKILEAAQFGRKQSKKKAVR